MDIKRGPIFTLFQNINIVKKYSLKLKFQCENDFQGGNQKCKVQNMLIWIFKDALNTIDFFSYR